MSDGGSPAVIVIGQTMCHSFPRPGRSNELVCCLLSLFLSFPVRPLFFFFSFSGLVCLSVCLSVCLRLQMCRYLYLCLSVTVLNVASGSLQVIKGWTEALQLMKEGDIWELVCALSMHGGSARGTRQRDNTLSKCCR